MKTWHWIILLLSVLSGEAAAQRIVTLATTEWGPYTSAQISRQGFTSEIVTEAFKRAGYKVHIRFMPWARALLDTQQGKYDAVYPAYYSDERAQVYVLSTPIAQGLLGLYKRKDLALDFRTLQDVQPYKIGIVNGYVNAPEFDAATYLNKEIAPSDESNLRKLLLGRVDLIAIDKYTAQYVIQTSVPEAAGKLVFVEPALQVQPIHVCFSKNKPYAKQVSAYFDRAIKSMVEDGTIDKIMQAQGMQ